MNPVIQKLGRKLAVLVAAASVAIGGGYAVKASLDSDCCHPGAACCKPGAACCKAHGSHT